VKCKSSTSGRNSKDTKSIIIVGVKSADCSSYGRKPAVLTPYFIAACFTFGTATAKDIQTIMLTRFFAGVFGSAPVTNTGGVLGDIWSPKQRGTAIVGYAFAVVGGPTLGPIVGGAIVQSYLSWRWTEYVCPHRLKRMKLGES
jgi:MFS family permease